MLPKQLKDSQRHQRQPKQVELFLQSRTKAITTGHWPLDYVTRNNWQKQFKNKKRDYQKYAIAAYVEETLVSTYHQTLFKQSSPAAALQDQLHYLLSKHTKKRRVIVPGMRKTETVQHYNFPDGIEDPPNITEYADNLGNIMNELMSTGQINIYIFLI